MKWQWHRKAASRESGSSTLPRSTFSQSFSRKSSRKSSRNAIPPDRIPLPQELINQIVDDLVERDAKDDLTRSCREDLLSCSVTSRSFRAQTIQYLFRTLDPQMMLTTHAYYAEFLAILLCSPHIARSYRVLRIRNAFPPIQCQGIAAETLSLLVNVSDIEVMDTKGFWGIGIGRWSLAIRAAMAALPIVRLSFEDVDFPSVDDFVHLVLDCFPRAESIHFHKVSEGPRSAGLLDTDDQRQTPTFCYFKEIIHCSSPTPNLLAALASGRMGRLACLETLDMYRAHVHGMYRAQVDGVSLTRFLSNTSLRTLHMPMYIQSEPIPCPFPSLETLTLSYRNFTWLLNSIPLLPEGASRLKIIGIRNDPFDQAGWNLDEDARWQRFDDLAVSYLNALTTVQMEGYSAPLIDFIMDNCWRLAERGVFHWLDPWERRASRV